MSYQANHELNWSGSCSGGMLDGRGTISHQTHNSWGMWARKWTGQFVDGVAQGDWRYHNDIAWDIGEATGDGKISAEFSMKDGRLDGEVTATVAGTRRDKDRQPHHRCNKWRVNYVNGDRQADGARYSDC